MNKLALMGIAAAAATASMVAAAPAEAALFTVGGTQYEVTTIEGFFPDFLSTLENQVWWGDATLATEFATVVNDDLGLPNGDSTSGNTNILGPIFLYQELIPGSTALGSAWNTTQNPPSAAPAAAIGGVRSTFAVATEVAESVPEPMTLLGLGAVGLVGAGSALKRQRSAKA
ncbi:PEP-CTERM sorting domain-containing protein [Leptolyngbya iicbica]|uniref:PEP-CTERM sorting domain-containing protein n=2 Tax=Cyanophyceae TaxID=3028117 RepID=A0A4Q7E2K1_9CYAN|nr:PEP-CTERM sorting domain-containing protein [Leptolyngbya sp. LK]RZM75415.1 PEP-CTERM sorting domain-containing protein [Leptolyngbya sp. LK]